MVLGRALGAAKSSGKDQEGKGGGKRVAGEAKRPPMDSISKGKRNSRQKSTPWHARVCH